MQKLVVIGDDLVLASRDGTTARITDMEGVANEIDRRQQCVVGVVACPTLLVTASAQTVDAAINARLLPNHSYRTEQIGQNLYQGFAIPDEPFDKLRRLGKKIYVVPYAAAVRKVAQAVPAGSVARRLTQVFLGKQSVPEAIAAETREVVVIDSVESDYLITVLRGQEVVAIRRIRGGDPVIELQRTLAASRMTSPPVLCSDRDLLVELQAKGFQASAIQLDGPVMGWQALEQTLDLQFLSAAEVARKSAARHRARAVGTLVVSALVATAAAGAWFATQIGLDAAQSTKGQIATEKAAISTRLAELYGERYPALAHRSTVHLEDDLFNVLLALPAQVKLVSLEKTPSSLELLIERRADAAPFGKGDLVSALAMFPTFAGATISEEFEGHVIRYRLTLPRAAPPQVADGL